MRIFVNLVLILALVVAGVAVYRNWVVVETSGPSETSDQTAQINIKIDPKKARQDVGSLVADEAIQGEITSVDAGQNQVVVRVGDAAQPVRVTTSTSIMRNGQVVSLDSLRPGEHAVVRLKDKRAGHEAVSITVNSN